ncbi:hypothetical protein HMPREF3200_01425 [Anaerococcus tetradius]|uniref:Uncharacterized protein n=1 Tax=Anaerococcus tetradius TaxID=33036 RepID=A0A133KCY5_9FIRM|nr:hypothetical protein HMPREF3200_01425 [Anaerococcus tetradius]
MCISDLSTRVKALKSCKLDRLIHMVENRVIFINKYTKIWEEVWRS